MKLNRDIPYQTDSMPFAVPTETGHVTGFLTIEGAQALADLLTRTERNIFRAVSKGQIQEIARGMLAKNWALAKEVDRLKSELAERMSSERTKEAVKSIRQAVLSNDVFQEGTTFGSSEWHCHEAIDDDLHSALALLGD